MTKRTGTVKGVQKVFFRFSTKTGWRETTSWDELSWIVWAVQGGFYPKLLLYLENALNIFLSHKSRNWWTNRDKLVCLTPEPEIWENIVERVSCLGCMHLRRFLFKKSDNKKNLHEIWFLIKNWYLQNAFPHSWNRFPILGFITILCLKFPILGFITILCLKFRALEWPVRVQQYQIKKGFIKFWKCTSLTGKSVKFFNLIILNLKVNISYNKFYEKNVDDYWILWITLNQEEYHESRRAELFKIRKLLFLTK